MNETDIAMCEKVQVKEVIMRELTRKELGGGVELTISWENLKHERSQSKTNCFMDYFKFKLEKKFSFDKNGPSISGQRNPTD